jgi:hypothetical protein
MPRWLTRLLITSSFFLLNGQTGLVEGTLDEGRDANSAVPEELAVGIVPEELELRLQALKVLVLAVAAD